MQLGEVPLHPGARPFFGHNLEMRADRLGFFARVAASRRPLVHLRAPATHIALVNDPALLQEMLVEKSRAFVKSTMLRWALYPLAGEGLFTSDGELWRRQRKLMAPLFHRAQLERYAADMVACAARATASWRDGEVVEIAPAMTHITMNVAGKTLFDAETMSEADELGAALTVVLDWSGDAFGSMFGILHLIARAQLIAAADKAPGGLGASLSRVAARFERPLFFPGAGGKKLREALAVLEARVARMIAERRAETAARDDLLSKLLGARDDDGAAMDDKQVRDEILTLFVAGHETTAAGLAWTFQLLHSHPEWLARVQAEVDALPGPPTLADLPRLPLCLRAFKEALRLYPPVYAFGRQTIEPVELGGVEIPRDVFVVVAPMALHQRPDVWPEPTRFDPDRFTPEAEAARHRYAWLPFGGGPRVCIGNHFAMMEAPLVMAQVLRSFRLEPLRREAPHCSAARRPGGPMPMRVHARAARAGA